MWLAWPEVWFATLHCLMCRELLKAATPYRWEGPALFVARCSAIKVHREAQRGRERLRSDARNFCGLLECCLWRDRHNRHHVERTDARVHPATDS
jgi:hypothetical protein